MKPQRVLHVFVSLPIGGAENLLLSNLRLLDPAKFQSVVCTLGEKGVLAEQVVRMGVPLVELCLMRNRGRGGMIVNALVDLIHREKISLVHTHLYHANYFGRLAARRAGVPCVVSVHNTYTDPKWHRRLINRWLARRHTGAIIAGSPEIRRDILRYDHVSPTLVEVIPNAVDLARSESGLSREQARARFHLDDDACVVGTVGRLEEQKGHRYLLEAIHHLKGSGLRVVVLLVGAGREEAALRERAKALNLGDDVRFLGMRNDLGDLFRAMDIFAMPSLWEGLSLAMLSAMAAGLPVVATDVGGVSDVLGRSERGFVLPPKDSVQLAQRILWCWAHRVESAEIAQRGREFVRSNYSDTAMVQRLMTIYENVLNTAPIHCNTI
jgi:glycosyltransferase involved in cell wall biosynthesis